MGFEDEVEQSLGRRGFRLATSIGGTLTWTSGPNTKIGANAFPKHTFDIRGVSIGGADLATVLNRKCGG
jgi:hypothetical protein